MDKAILLKPKNFAQKNLQESMAHNIVSIASGCAGTGKTLIALNYGIHMLTEKLVKKVIYIRPDTGTDYQRGRGALKGDLKEKSLPLLGPVLDNIGIFLNQGHIEYILKKELLEYIYLEDVRGRSFNDTFVIFDEAQNSTQLQVKTLLTRIGSGSKIVICGDTLQVDVRDLRPKNGLSDAIDRLGDIKNVGITQFTRDDIVRSSVIRYVLDRYDNVS